MLQILTSLQKRTLLWAEFLQHEIKHNWSAKTRGCHVRVWDDVKRAYKIDGFIESLTGTLEKNTLRFLNIAYYDEADLKSAYDSRKYFRQHIN